MKLFVLDVAAEPRASRVVLSGVRKKHGQFSGCVIKVENVPREMYFLPRSPGDTDAVIAELDGRASGHFESWHCEVVHIDMALLPGGKTVSRRRSWVKLTTLGRSGGFQWPASGTEYRCCASLGRDLAQQWVLANGIRGPCWIRVVPGRRDVTLLASSSAAPLSVLSVETDLTRDGGPVGWARLVLSGRDCELMVEERRGEDVPSWFAATVRSWDPDILVGEDLLGGVLSTLLSRRMKSIARAGGSYMRQAFGRMLVDTRLLARDLGGEITGPDFIERRDEILQLFGELARISCCPWARVWSGGRVERTDWMLASEFAARGYLFPDRTLSERSPASYKGGEVLTPIGGIHQGFLALADVHSLYPSVIQAYDLCFDKKRRGDRILPALMRALMEQRALHEKESPTGTALKLAANSAYGCMGSAFSLFHSPGLAREITARGREELLAARDAVERAGFTVVLGDTDSVAFPVESASSADEAAEIAGRVMREINEASRQAISMDVQSIFDGMVISHKKKKYAGTEVWHGTTIAPRTVVKGMELVRSDWCGASRDSCRAVLEILLAHARGEMDATETAVALAEALDAIRAKDWALEDLVMTRPLTEPVGSDPIEAHVRVAARLVSERAFVGTRVPFVMAAEDCARLPGTRIFHPSEMRFEGLRADMDWYMKRQIAPPVLRLCALLPGMDIDCARALLGVASAPNARSRDRGISIYRDCEPIRYPDGRPWPGAFALVRAACESGEEEVRLLDGLDIDAVEDAIRRRENDLQVMFHQFLLDAKGAIRMARAERGRAKHIPRVMDAEGALRLFSLAKPH